METPISTDKPLAAGNGRGQSKTGSTSSKNRTESGAPESTPTEREPSTSQGSSPRGADGQTIPISEGGLTDSVIDRGRGLGRQAGELGKRVSTMTQEYTKREPTRSVLISLGVGVVLGTVIGILFSRD
jgi:hypothetical protein